MYRKLSLARIVHHYSLVVVIITAIHDFSDNVDTDAAGALPSRTVLMILVTTESNSYFPSS